MCHQPARLIRIAVIRWVAVTMAIALKTPSCRIANCYRTSPYISERFIARQQKNASIKYFKDILLLLLST